MEQIIKLAIEGGYKWNWQDRGHEVFGENNASTKYVCNFAHVLDPLFWQALGKACGWENKQHPHARVSLGFEYDQPITEALVQKRIHAHVYHALRFHEINLTESFEKAIEYLKEVTK